MYIFTKRYLFYLKLLRNKYLVSPVVLLEALSCLEIISNSSFLSEIIKLLPFWEWNNINLSKAIQQHELVQAGITAYQSIWSCPTIKFDHTNSCLKELPNKMRQQAIKKQNMDFALSFRHEKHIFSSILPSLFRFAGGVLQAKIQDSTAPLHIKIIPPHSRQDNVLSWCSFYAKLIHDQS